MCSCAGLSPGTLLRLGWQLEQAALPINARLYCVLIKSLGQEHVHQLLGKDANIRESRVASHRVSACPESTQSQGTSTEGHFDILVARCSFALIGAPGACSLCALQFNPGPGLDSPLIPHDAVIAEGLAKYARPVSKQF